MLVTRVLVSCFTAALFGAPPLSHSLALLALKPSLLALTLIPKSGRLANRSTLYLCHRDLTKVILDSLARLHKWTD